MDSPSQATPRATPQRFKISTTLDWVNIMSSGPKTGTDLYSLRTACYKDIEQIRGHPLIVYASNFTTPLSQFSGGANAILLDDLDGFTDLISRVSADVKEVDIIIHSGGGSADATERIVSILRNRFEKVHFLVPHSAYSAATMLALSGDSIVLHPSATLGPIDPQLDGIPARSIIRGFENVREAIKREGPEALPAYIPLIEKYTLSLLEQCNDADLLSKQLVSAWITNYMLKGVGNAETIENAVTYFSNYDAHKTHSRPLFYEKIKGFGLNIEQSNDELSKLLWEANIVLNGFFTSFPFSKLYEDSNGFSFGRQFVVPQQLAQQNQAPPSPPQNEVV